MTIVLNSTGNGSISGSNIVITKPTVSVGDVLLVIVGGGGTTAVTPPSGWTTGPASGGGSSPQVRAFTRTIDGSEGSTFSFPFGSSTNIMANVLAVSGLDPNFSIDVSNPNGGFSSTTNTNPGVTTRLANELLIGASVHNTAGSSPSLSSATGTSAATQTSGGYGLSVRQLAQATAGASGAFTWTWSLSGATWQNFVLALRPSGQNLPPSVTIPAPSTLIYGNTFTTTATGVDVEGAVTYAWTNVSPPVGSTATISGASTATMTFKPDVPGTYTFQCTVTDTSSATASASISFLVRAEMWVRKSGTAKAALRRSRKNGSVY